MNIYDYVKKYGDLSFEDEPFNDVDNVVFSLLSYLNFLNTDINIGYNTLKFIGNQYLKSNKYKDVSRLGIAQKDAYKLIKLVIKTKRYENILLKDYIYEADRDTQFSALTFEISKKMLYICFEGTDELISGWKEDFYLSCSYPVIAQTKAIEYVKKHVKLFGPKVIIGGHSKGGNLALVSSMNLNFLKKLKLIKVYSNDGPGLRKKELESKKYKKIKNKFIHYVPEASVVGVMLRNDVYNVIKSKVKNILAHSPATWIIDDKNLVPGNLLSKSIKLEENLISWLDMHNDEERKKIIDAVFDVLEEENITNIMSLIKFKNVVKIINDLKNIDDESKMLINDFIKYNLSNMI